MNRQAIAALAVIAAIAVMAAAVVVFGNGDDDEDTSDLIRVGAPREGDLVSSPLVIEGEARGNWFFEATFPITLLDADGNVIARSIGMTPGDWTTEEFLPFSSTLEFDAPGTDRGTLLLEKDNPSLEPEFDAELRIEVRFR